MLVYTVMTSSGITMLEGKFAARSNPPSTLHKPIPAPFRAVKPKSQVNGSCCSEQPGNTATIAMNSGGLKRSPDQPPRLRSPERRKQKMPAWFSTFEYPF
jgi:hypothetical protein